ncbi:MAG: glutamyl-tRNA reductase [Puniceicoccales bacterium]|nr:glutamyl-tRNA reductase [Puniceicoccales bacterium]
MSTTENSQNYVVGVLACTHETTPLALREKLAIAPERAAVFYKKLRALPGVAECVVLGTCNRLEIYVATAAPPPRLARERTAPLVVAAPPPASFVAPPECLIALLAEHQTLAAGVLAAHCRWFADVAAVEHLFRVGAGLDSQMVGESEILGQARDAYAEALARGDTGPVLNRVFQKSFQAAAWARTHTPIGQGQVSIGSVAVEMATRVFGNLAGSRVLVLGTGEVGRKTAQAFVSRGAGSLTVASRTFANALALAASVGGTAVEMADALAALGGYDIVIGSAATTEALTTANAVRLAARARAGEPLFLIDLGLPRNFPPDSATIPSVYLYNLDDLSGIANENLRARRAGMNAAKTILAGKAARLWERVAQH